MSEQTLLEVKALSCVRDDRLLFDNLNLAVKPGEIWRIEGPNGSGKTTFIRTVCGLFTDYEGDISYCGENLRYSRHQFTRETLFIGHKTGVKPSLSAEENLAWLCGMRTVVSKQQIQQALTSVGLRGFEDLPAYSLSAGQQRRIALARLFLESAKLWILDEPFTAIDYKGVGQLEQHLQEHAEAGGAIILTTHHDLAIEREVKSVRLGGNG